jgi:hypothetical protein
MDIRYTLLLLTAASAVAQIVDTPDEVRVDIPVNLHGGAPAWNSRFRSDARRPTGRRSPAPFHRSFASTPSVARGDELSG